MNIKKNISKIIFAASLLVFLLTLLLFFFVYGGVKKNNEKLRTYITEWDTISGQKGDVFSLHRLLGEISQEREEIDSHFANERDMVSFLDTLELLAPKTGVRLEVGSVSSKENNAKLQVGLKATGNFSSVYKFLTLLENSPYELDFLSVDFRKIQAVESNDKKMKEPTWEAIFKIQLLGYIP